MLMSDGEIVTNYRQAANHKTQVGILADLNGVSHTKMEEHLKSLGCIKATPEPSFDWIRAAELYADGKCDLDIAEIMGVSKGLVAKWRKSKKFKANYPKGSSAIAEKAKPVPTPQIATVEVKQAAYKLPVYGMSVSAMAALLTKIADGFPDAEVVMDGG
ncbi:MAG: helix-turn-helix domain-containing protein, partial [Oscillospiraceae bacterium]